MEFLNGLKNLISFGGQDTSTSIFGEYLMGERMFKKKKKKKQKILIQIK